MGAHLPKGPLAVVTCLQCPYLMKFMAFDPLVTFGWERSKNPNTLRLAVLLGSASWLHCVYWGEISTTIETKYPLFVMAVGFRGQPESLFAQWYVASVSVYHVPGSPPISGQPHPLLPPPPPHQPTLLLWRYFTLYASVPLLRAYGHVLTSTVWICASCWNANDWDVCVVSIQQCG